MHLGFDAKRLFNNFTGLGNYSRTLLRDLADAAPDTSYYLFTPRVIPSKETQFFLTNPSYQLVQPSNRSALFWRSLRIKQDLQHHKIDLYHGLSHELPWGIAQTGIPSVVTIHDLIFEHYPAQYAWLDRQIYGFKFRTACRAANKVVAISESTKQDIRHFFGTPEGKIQVIYQSCDERFLLKRSSSVLKEVRSKYGLPADFSLYVGSLIPRKNLVGIIEALALLPPSLRSPLVIVGTGSAAYKKTVEQRAATLGVLPLLHFKNIEFADLPAVYQSAQVFLYPSFYEGFGIPVIEALNSGVPVITSKRSSLPEAAGPDSYLVDPSQYSEIAKAWQSILEDTQVANQMRQAGRRYAERFRSDKIIPQWLALYEQLAR